jgi:tetratricopeptide (TPR) repeat protein
MKSLDAIGDPIDLFGGEASPLVAQLLQDAAAVYQQTNRAEAILWSAQAIDPACLPVYFALYKFYFYKFRLEDAEKVALMGLQTAANQGDFPFDWWRLSRADADWDSVVGAPHFYLFTLKALAFIRLRLGKRAESLALLDKLKQLDPKDSVGASVIRDLASELI